MKKSVTGLKNRILSWLLALTMIVSMVCSNGTVAFATAAGNPDPVSVTLGITGSDGKDLAGKAEVEFTASGSVGSPVTGKAGETIELQSATAYSYKITCIGYKEQAGNFTTTAEAAQTFTKSLEVKNSEITFVTKANGSAISNVQVSVDGGTAETVDGAGKLVKQLQEGGKYRIVANADGYDTKDFEYTVPTGTDKAVSEIDMGDKYAVVNFSVTHGSNKLSSATISCKENTTGTEIKAIYDATKGT